MRKLKSKIEAKYRFGFGIREVEEKERTIIRTCYKQT